MTNSILGRHRLRDAPGDIGGRGNKAVALKQYIERK